MLTPDRGVLRALRSGVLAVVVLGLSAGAHALAGGALPGAGPLAAVGAVVLLTCSSVTRWRLGTGGVVALLGAGQVVLHEVLMALAPPSAAVGHGSAHAVATGGAHHGDGALWLAGPTTADATMLVAHAAAALALALVCSRGEDALWGLCAWFAPLLGPLLVLPGLVEARPGAVPADAPRPLPRWAPLRSTRRRGPPLPLAA